MAENNAYEVLPLEKRVVVENRIIMGDRERISEDEKKFLREIGEEVLRTSFVVFRLDGSDTIDESYIIGNNKPLNVSFLGKYHNRDSLVNICPHHPVDELSVNCTIVFRENSIFYHATREYVNLTYKDKDNKPEGTTIRIFYKNNVMGNRGK